MSVKIIIDMNLAREWEALLQAAGWMAVHWSSVGDPRAPDHEIMDWARENGYVVFTHDLDFGTMLALTHMSGPSVLQVRAQDTLAGSYGRTCHQGNTSIRGGIGIRCAYRHRREKESRPHSTNLSWPHTF